MKNPKRERVLIGDKMITKKDLEGIARGDVIEVDYKEGSGLRGEELRKRRPVYFIEYVPKGKKGEHGTVISRDKDAIRVIFEYDQDGRYIHYSLFLPNIRQIKKYIPSSEENIKTQKGKERDE